MERPLTEHIIPGQFLSLKDYEGKGGYSAFRKTIGKIAPGDVTNTVKDSNLKGRGGAGFNTGLKWSFVPMGENAPEQKYLIANADEMEPGTFKDRILLEGNPHMLIEGMILSAYAIGAKTGFIFLRSEYRMAEKIIKEALSQAYQGGYLGKNLAGSEFSFDLYLHTSIGRYICGEETALINALEGKRANPRAKPPFPQTCGLFGKPTIVNNVETLCCVPHILEKGAEWFRNLSVTDEGGTKIYGVSGKVKRPGAWELPLGITMRELLEEHAGGMRDGLKFRGSLPGGASTDFLVEEHLDIKMDFVSVAQAGSRLGTGTMIILDDKTCPVGMVHNLQKFFAQESCGWCTPCRDGLPWVARILQAMEEGQGREEDIDILNFHTKYLGPGNTFCALAPGAMEPLQSALKYFGDDFKKHISEQRCPWRS
jgi:NADH-quinone oxidoreductase subunit F